jgi:hypothetical protein
LPILTAASSACPFVLKAFILYADNDFINKRNVPRIFFLSPTTTPSLLLLNRAALLA